MEVLRFLLAPFIAHTASIQADGLTHSSAQFTVFATGLNNPRGGHDFPDAGIAGIRNEDVSGGADEHTHGAIKCSTGCRSTVSAEAFPLPLHH